MRRIKKEIKGEKESRVLIEGEPEEGRRIKKGKFQSAPLPSLNRTFTGQIGSPAAADAVAVK